eukprot:6552097-Pyramimonas_sp.AAC.1
MPVVVPPLGLLLGLFWGPHGPCWGASWAALGSSWEPLGPSLGDLGGLSGALGGRKREKAITPKLLKNVKRTNT